MKEPVQVQFHLNGGYTKLLLERYKNNGQAFPAIDIPTNKIPAHLRKIGSHFEIIIEGTEITVISEHFSND